MSDIAGSSYRHGTEAIARSPAWRSYYHYQRILQDRTMPSRMRAMRERQRHGAGAK